MKIVADDKIPFLKGVLEPFAEVIYLPGNEITNSTLKNADALLIRSITHCDEELLSDTPVKLIASATIGDDHIDKNYCSERGIRWSTAQGCNAEAVNQYVQTALTALSKLKKYPLEGKTMAIIGVGNIGSRVQRTAESMGMKTLLNDPPRERQEQSKGYSSLDEIRQQADIISLHVPLTFGGEDKTFHLVDHGFIEGFAKPVVLINSSRGAVADTGALKKGVGSGKISGLALDVWENEPDPDPELLEMATLATPHIAGYSVEGKTRATAMTVQAVSRFFGLGLDDREPPIPGPLVEIRLDCQGHSPEGVLIRVFDKVFPVLSDSMALKRQPQKFEEFRRNYIFRRENPNYLLGLKNCSNETILLLNNLGFRVQINHKKN